MPGAVTLLLQRYCAGDKAVEAELITQVYGELKRLARMNLRRTARDGTLQPTALVNEAYLKLAGAEAPQWQDRAHFFRVAARAMRQVITDNARARLTGKRGGGFVFLPLEEARLGDVTDPEAMLELHDALERLAAMDPRAHEVVELRFFGGLSVEQTAQVLGASARTVKREWRSARAWLMNELQAKGGAPCSQIDGSA